MRLSYSVVAQLQLLYFVIVVFSKTLDDDGMFTVSLSCLEMNPATVSDARRHPSIRIVRYY